MANAFLLRFQEPCVECISDTVLGTSTKTSVGREQPDTDPAQNSYSAIVSGTETVTRVATENRDADFTTGSNGLPRTAISMGTETMTAVRAEASDTDPGQLTHRVLAR